ncbi:MAG: hypothetical protein ACYC6F_17810 [Longimicrobiales bacterium]
MITGAELEQYQGDDLLGLILRARRTWLQTRPSLIVGEEDANPIVVVIDGVPQMPGLDPLILGVADVREVRRLSASDATTRFGTNMTAGAILVVTKHWDVAAALPVRRTEVPGVEPGPGDRVRLAADTTLTGVVRWLTADSISVLADGTGQLQTFVLSSLQRLDVARGRELKKDRVLLIGALGGIVGYLIGKADNHYGDPAPPHETFCLQAGGGASCTSWREAGAVLEFTVGGVVLGGLYGALFAQGDRWESVPLLPAAVSADWDQGGRLQVGFSVPSR